jgi:hypothetical protein
LAHGGLHCAAMCHVKGMNFGHEISSLVQSAYCGLAQKSIADSKSRNFRSCAGFLPPE